MLKLVIKRSLVIIASNVTSFGTIKKVPKHVIKKSLVLIANKVTALVASLAHS